MSAFKPFELQAIRLLTAGVLSAEMLEAVAAAQSLDDYEYTGCGYFAMLKHPGIPQNRVVCHEPKVAGESGGVRCGFIVFLQDNQLTLECYSWGAENVPATYRDQDVRVAAANA